MSMRVRGSSASMLAASGRRNRIRAWGSALSASEDGCRLIFQSFVRGPTRGLNAPPVRLQARRATSMTAKTSGDTVSGPLPALLLIRAMAESS